MAVRAWTSQYLVHRSVLFDIFSFLNAREFWNKKTPAPKPMLPVVGEKCFFLNEMLSKFILSCRFQKLLCFFWGGWPNYLFAFEKWSAVFAFLCPPFPRLSYSCFNLCREVSRTFNEAAPCGLGGYPTIGRTGLTP